MARTSLTTVLATLLIAAVAFSCSPTNQSLKRSKKLAAAGLTYEATVMSLEALERKPGNQKAMIQVKTYGEKEIKAQLREFRSLLKLAKPWVPWMPLFVPATWKTALMLQGFCFWNLRPYLGVQRPQKELRQRTWCSKGSNRSSKRTLPAPSERSLAPSNTARRTMPFRSCGVRP